MPQRVAVIGGGISGLAAARALRAAGLEVVVLEATDRLGGKIRSGSFEGRPIELGPDNFLTRDPSAARLCRELGLGDDLVAPRTSSASVVVHGRLHRLPPGLVLGIPTDLGALARSGILSPAGLVRAGLDLTLPGRPITARQLGLDSPQADGPRSWTAGEHGEWTAAALLERRLGHEVVERLVDPLLGGINAGSTEHLSLAVVAPQVAAALVGRRSVIEALRPLVPPPPSGAATPAPDGAPARDPLFLGLRGGLERMIEHLAADLERSGVELRRSSPARSIAVGAAVGGTAGLKVATDDGPLEVDAVVLAAPGYAAAPLLHDLAPPAAAELASIPYASVALVTMSWPDGALDRLPEGSGFLVPRREGGLVTGCTVLSQKWAAMALDGRVLVRASTGRYGDERPGALDDDALIDAVLTELRPLVGVRRMPDETSVQRYDRALPQYLPGHLGRVARARRALGGLPPIELAGATLGGVGIPACLSSGERAAAAVLERLRG